MTNILKFFILFYKRLHVIIIAIFFTTIIYLAYFKMTPSTENLYEGRFAWDMIRVSPVTIHGSMQNADYKDGNDFYISREVLAVSPHRLQQLVNTNMQVFAEAKKYNCNISVEDWFRGKYEVLHNRNLGQIELRLNEFEKEQVLPCKNFFYNLFLEENFKSIDTLIASLDFMINKENDNLKNIENYLEDFLEDKTKTSEFLISEFYKLKIMSSNKIKTYLTSRNTLINIEKKLDVKYENIKKSSNLLFYPGLIFSISLGLLFSIISILILDFKKFRKLISK